MRLWHYKLIPYLPSSQLIAQWRELNSIFKNRNKHILINYIYTYPKCYLWEYTMITIKEMEKRNISIKSLANADNYFEGLGSVPEKIKYLYPFEEHNVEYLTICYWNLREKYLRGQKDFTKDIWKKLDTFFNKEVINAFFDKENKRSSPIW